MKVLTVSASEAGRSILKYVEVILKDVPKSKIEKMFRNKDISINGLKIKDKKILIETGDKIMLYGVKSKIKKPRYEKLNSKLEIIYEDNNILAISKRVGIVTNGQKNSLDQQVLNYLRWKKTRSFTPASAGRLDRITSGIVIYGKNYKTVKQLKGNQKHWYKIYTFKSRLPVSITTNLKIIHDEKNRKQKCGFEGNITTTIFEVKGHHKTAQIITGKKHQIRASLAMLGFPIEGDVKYGGKKSTRVFLHCMKIIFKGLDGHLQYLNDLEILNEPQW